MDREILVYADLAGFQALVGRREITGSCMNKAGVGVCHLPTILILFHLTCDRGY
jgi:hypothetical protein